MKSDRVNELYRGEIWGRKNQQACRDRIHWMCSRVTGRRVLDVGCSQGIATLLLGREGHEVVGVDIDPTAIEFAQRELAACPDFVKENVEFRPVAAHELPFEDGSFDTILLGEVIEHLTHPELMLAETRRLLKPGGTMVITTPFGVHPDPGHVRAFYLSDFLQAVEGFFDTRQLCVLDKYICYAGVAGDGDGSVPASRLLQLSEEAFKFAELRYVEQLEAHRSKCNALQMEMTTLKSGALARQDEISKLSRKLAAAERWRAGSVQFIQQFQGLLASSGADVDLSRLAERAKRISSRVSANVEAAHELEALGEVGHDLFEAFEARLLAKEREFANLGDVHRAEIERQRTESERRLADELQGLNEAQQKRAGELERALNAKTAQLEQSYRIRKDSEQKVTHLQSRLDQQSESINQLKAELNLKYQEVRYRLGDAFVRAATSPTGFLLLPFRFVRLFSDGLRRRHERCRAERRSREAAAAASKPKGNAATSPAAAPAPKAPAAPKTAATPTPRPAAVESKLEFRAVEVPKRPPRLPVKAAAIMDEFTFACFEPECQLIPVNPDDWKQVLSEQRPDFLFVESAWAGNGGSWRYKLVRPDKIEDGPLFELVQRCRSQNIPTVFWNKEDPPSFDEFIHAAVLFDYIFTSDANCVPRYREVTGHDRIYPLPFAAQPAIHNPIDARRNLVGTVCFAGSYYAKRHKERQGEMELLLRPALQRGLHIYDRQANLPSDRYRFPDVYQPAIKGSLSYPEMLDAYKRYRVFLNVNSVSDSPTMFSRRVLELLACGTPVVSTYAAGIEQLLGHECVALVETEEETAQWLDVLLKNPDVGERMVKRGMRRILAEHTYAHRLQTILRTIGLGGALEVPRVTVVSCTIRPHQLENVIANYERQAYPNKELVVILNNDAFVLDDVRRRLECVENARVFQLPESYSLGKCLNFAIERREGEYVAKCDDDDFYGQHYLTDLMAAFTYSDAGVVGKRSCYIHLEGSHCLAVSFPNYEYRYSEFLQGASLVISGRALDEIRFEDRSCGEDTQFLQRCRDRGFKLYSADRFNYVMRRAKSAGDHTWQVRDAQLLRNCQIVAYTDDYRAEVEV